MTRTVLLSSVALDLTSFNLTVAQNGITETEPVARWGDASTGGTVSIVLDRTDGEFAPDRVRFTVDLSQATFTTTETYDPVANQSYSSGYDCRVAGLVYLWDMDDAGTWAAPEKTLTAWKSKAQAKGPLVQHVYAADGTKTVTLTVLEPSTGLISFASATFIVKPQDAEFPGAQTICVNPVGDTDFSAAPAGAVQLNIDTLDTASQEWIDNGTGKKRWMFKRGGTFSVGLRVRSDTSGGTMWCAYGSGALPILTFEGDKMFQLDIFNEPVKRDYRFADLHISGGFDPTTTLIAEFADFATVFSGNGSQAIDLTLNNLTVRGCPGSVVSLNSSNDADADFRYAFDGLDITDCGGRYNIIIGTSENPESTVSLTGSKIAQNPNSLSDDSDITANLRVNGVKFTYVAGNDLFNLSENNPSIKVCEMDGFTTVSTIDPQLVNIHSNTIEANTGLISVAQGMDDRGATVQNVLIHGNILCGAWNVQQFFRLCATGITISDNLCWQPNLASSNGVGLRGWNSFVMSTGATGSQAIPDAPVQFLRNTLVNDRSSANNENNTSLLFSDENGQFVAAGVQADADNIVNYVNLDVPETPFAPLSSDPIITPRSVVGRILSTDRPSPTPEAARATIGNMASYAPDPGSSAIGAASADAVGRPDLLGTTRTNPASIGSQSA